MSTQSPTAVIDATACPGMDGRRQQLALAKAQAENDIPPVLDSAGSGADHDEARENDDNSRPDRIPTTIRTSGQYSSLYDLMGGTTQRRVLRKLLVRYPLLHSLCTPVVFAGRGQTASPAITQAGWAIVQAVQAGHEPDAAQVAAAQPGQALPVRAPVSAAQPVHGEDEPAQAESAQPEHAEVLGVEVAGSRIRIASGALDFVDPEVGPAAQPVHPSQRLVRYWASDAVEVDNYIVVLAMLHHGGDDGDAAAALLLDWVAGPWGELLTAAEKHGGASAWGLVGAFANDVTFSMDDPAGVLGRTVVALSESLASVLALEPEPEPEPVWETRYLAETEALLADVAVPPVAEPKAVVSVATNGGYGMDLRRKYRAEADAAALALANSASPES